jgi:hypothetical protein
LPPFWGFGENIKQSKMKRIRRITALSAVTATTTSSKFWVGGARRVGIMLRAAAITSGNGAFAIKGSLQDYGDANGTPEASGNRTGGVGVTMTALNVFIDNVTNTNAQTLTRVNGKTLSSNIDAFLWLSPECLMNWLEITVTRTTDGTYSAWIIVEDDDISNGTF